MSFIKKFILVFFIFLIAFVAYTVYSTGFFRSVENTFEGTIAQKIPLPGVEDITISTIDSFAILSSTKRLVYPPKQEEKGGLYIMDLKDEKFTIKHLTASFDKPFAPHGISMFKKDSVYTIMAINHTLGKHSIEVFSYDSVNFNHIRTIRDPSMISPNDLVLIDENRFYFTNDHGYTKGIGKFFEEYGGLSVSNVVYYNGESFIESADGIAYANGINFDATRNLMFVASPRGFEIKVYSKKEDGSLEFIENIPCKTGVDNIEIDANQNLWSAGHPNLLRFKAYAKGKRGTAPSEIIKIQYRAKNDYTVEQVFTDTGENMSGSSVATFFNGMIFTGNVMDDKFLILSTKDKRH